MNQPRNPLGWDLNNHRSQHIDRGPIVCDDDDAGPWPTLLGVGFAAALIVILAVAM